MKQKIAIVLYLFAATAGAATVNLTKDSDNGFTNAYGWASGKAPEAGNDYLVANGYYLRGDNSQGFAGDSLQFGIVGESEGVFFKEHTGTHTFTKLILANGYYRTWMSNDGQAAHICGAVEVTSPDFAPFRLHGSHNSGTGWYLTYWDAAFTGAEGTGLRVGPHPNALRSPCQTIFTGDNSAYLGSIEAYGTNAVFAFTTGSSLGGALSAFKADALTLSDGTTLESRGDDVTLSSSLNRGLTVDETGGRISVPENKSLCLEWPIVGTGPLAKTGKGTLTLAAAMNLVVPDSAAAALTVSNGCLRFAAGFSNSGDGGIAVLPNCEVTVAAGDEVTVRNLALDGAIRISYDGSMATAGVLVLDGSCTPSWPIPVYPPNVREIKVPFLKVPTSVKTVTASDFAKPEDLAATGLPSAKFTVETDGGMQTVYAEMSALVTAVGTPAYFIYEAAKWSDSNTPHSGADYQVGSGKKLLTQGLSAEYTFKGESLYFVGASGSKAIWEFNTGIDRFTADLRAGAYVYATPKAKTGTELHLCGRLFLNMANSVDSDNGLDFRGMQNNLTVFIDSVVSGNGRMSFQPYAANYTNTYFFTADNTHEGTYFVYGGSQKEESLTVLKFAKAESWGTNPHSSKENGVQLQGRTELYPVGSQIINLPNQQVKFYSTGSRLRVDAGEVFELKSPVKFNNGGSAQYVANVTKIGGGTWAVGGSVTVERNGLSEWPRLTIQEGFIRPDNPIAFRNVAVTVGENGGIAAKYRPGETSDVATYGMIVTNAARFAVSGEILKFKVETGGERISASERISLLTVPGETATAIDAKRVVFEHDDSAGRTAVLERDEVTYSSKPYIRYSCRFIRGLKIILR